MDVEIFLRSAVVIIDAGKQCEFYHGKGNIIKVN